MAARKMSAHAREALEQSLRETIERDEGYIRVEHVLLALLRDPRNGAARTLDDLGAPAVRIRREIERQLSSAAGDEEGAAPVEPTGHASRDRSRT